MNRSTGGAVMSRIAFVVAAAGLALVIAGGGSSLPGPGTIRVTDKLVKHIHVDGGPGRAGDLDFYRQSLYNKGITKSPIGHSDLTCTNTGTGSQSCSGTYFLPKGKIMVTGVIASRLFYDLAVIGGTGLYDNVRGTLTVTYLGGSPEGEFLLFRLVV
jgi:hypothetical protein